jgi:hypothetical protein
MATTVNRRTDQVPSGTDDKTEFLCRVAAYAAVAVAGMALAYFGLIYLLSGG